MESFPQTKRFRFHILGLVHLPVTRRYMGCAFTMKVYRMCQMLMSLGHEVILYGAEGSDAPCSEFVETHSIQEIFDTWGCGDNRFELGYDWKSEGFRHDFNDLPTLLTMAARARTIAAIEERKRPDDFLLLTQGVYQKPVADAVGLTLTCEPGIGYRGSYARYRAFESAYLMNFTYGSENPRASVNGNHYDRVIPNYFDLGDFTFEAEKDDYFFFIGRIITRKGVEIAMRVAEILGKRLLVAGQGNEVNVHGRRGVEYVGYVGPEERDRLMGRAEAVFVPTLYLEAFGGVNVEAQLCGTPVLTTNFGVFPETVIHGITGFRCNTLDDFVYAGMHAHELDPWTIRQHALRYAMDNVRWEFQRWFEDLYMVYESINSPGMLGWNRLRANAPEWRQHEWDSPLALAGSVSATRRPPSA